MKTRKGQWVAMVMAAICAWVYPAQAAFIGGLDLISNSSIFETGAVAPLPAQGWTEVSGAEAQIFDAGGNGSLVATEPYANYQVEYLTGVLIQANTVYTLHFDMGFIASLTGGTADFSFQLGTTNGGVFTPLGMQIGSISWVSNYHSTGIRSGFDDLGVNTGGVVSGDELAVRWAQTGTTGSPFSDFFCFDNVTLDATPIPEPGSFVLLATAALGLGALHGRRRRWRHHG